MAQVGHPWGGKEELWSSAVEHLVRAWKGSANQRQGLGAAGSKQRLRAAGCQTTIETRLPSPLCSTVSKIFKPWHLSSWQAGTGGPRGDFSGASLMGLASGWKLRSPGIRYAPIAQSAIVIGGRTIMQMND
jgi:hypothetical protein